MREEIFNLSSIENAVTRLGEVIVRCQNNTLDDIVRDSLIKRFEFTYLIVLKYISFIKKTIYDVLPDVEIFIFGSRTQGKARECSDGDIALKSSDETPFTDFLKLKCIFEDSTFPYKVDIVDLHTINEDFFKIIEPDLYKL